MTLDIDILGRDLTIEYKIVRDAEQETMYTPAYPAEFEIQSITDESGKEFSAIIERANKIYKTDLLRYANEQMNNQ